MASEIILAKRLSKNFGLTKALDNIDLNIDRRGLHLLLGPNGSGKSTLIKLCLGLLRPSRGDLVVLGYKPWLKRHVISSKIMFVVENFSMPWWMNGINYARAYSRLRDVDWSLLYENLVYFNVTEYWWKPIYAYSSGMRKKLMLALGLVSGYELYLLDEPFTLIDKGSRRKTIELIEKLAKESTIVLATHILPEELFKLTETTTILVNGKMELFLDRKNIDSLREDIPLKVVVKLKTVDEVQQILSTLREHGGIDEVSIDIERKIISFTTTKSKLKPGILQEYEHEVYIDVASLYAKIF